MKKRYPLIIIGLSLIAILGPVVYLRMFLLSDPPPVHHTLSALHVEGARIVDANGRDVTLVGFNYGDHPRNLPAMTGDPVANAWRIKNTGFNAVRLVKEWGALENSSSPSDISYNENNFTLLSNQINGLTSQGLYVIIKLHADADNSYDNQSLLRFLGPSQYCNTYGDYLSKMGDTFFMTNSSLATSGFYHLTQLWLKISRITSDNPLVVGYDLLNEPVNCSTTSPSTIRAAWHARIGELLKALRDTDDNRIAFIQEAPFFSYYGGGAGGAVFSPYSDPLSNTVSSIHWYRDEYPVPSKSWQACSGDLQTLRNYYGNVTGNVTAPSGTKCPNTPIYAYQAQENFTSQAFDIGEFGAIWGNIPGDVNEQWIINSTLLFRAQHLTGWFYWSSNTTGTWIHDITGNFTLALSPDTVTLTGPANMVNTTLTVTTTHPFTNTATISFTTNDPFTNSTLGPVIQFSPANAKPAPAGGGISVVVSVSLGQSITSKTYRFAIYASTESGLTNTTVLTVVIN